MKWVRRSHTTSSSSYCHDHDHRRLEIVALEILLRTGKGDGRPPSQQRIRCCEWVDGVRRDVQAGSSSGGGGGGGGGTMTWSLHMPALKALHVAEASEDPRREAYEALAACTAAGLGLGSGLAPAPGSGPLGAAAD